MKIIKGILCLVFMVLIALTVVFVGNAFNEHILAHFFIGIGCLMACAIDYTILFFLTEREI